MKQAKAWDLESRAALQGLLRDVGIVPDRRPATEMLPATMAVTGYQDEPLGPGPAGVVTRLVVGGADVTDKVSMAKLTMRGGTPDFVLLDEVTSFGPGAMPTLVSREEIRRQLGYDQL